MSFARFLAFFAISAVKLRCALYGEKLSEQSPSIDEPKAR